MGNKSSSRLKENDDDGNVKPSKRSLKKAKSTLKQKPPKSKSTSKGNGKGNSKGKGKNKNYKSKKERNKNICSRPLLTPDKTEDAPFSPMSYDEGMISSSSPNSSDTQQTARSPIDEFVSHLDLNLFPSPEKSTNSTHQEMPPSPPIPRRLAYIHETQNNPLPLSTMDATPNLVVPELLPSTQSANIIGADDVKGGDNDHDSISSESLLSNSVSPSTYSISTYSTDLESIGKFSTDTSLSDLSFSNSIASLNLKRKKRRSPPQPQLQNSRVSSSNQGLSGSKKKRRNCTERPMAHNAFETLPRHLIKSALVRQATTTLRDERFVRRRIVKLGPVPAAKIHVSDLLYLQKREEKDCERRETLGVEASMPDASLFWDGDCAMSVTLESFDLFQKCILELCSVRMVNLAVDCELLNGDAAACGDIRPSTAEKKKSKTRAIAILDAAKAIYLLGKCVHRKEWNEEAMEYYRSALFLFLTELGIQEPCLLDESGDCAGFFYVRIANAGVDIYSTVHKNIATLLTKMGDIHGKNNEINDALHSYRASQVFWKKYLSEKKIASVNDCECVADMVDLDDHAAAVEGLALTHNRIGGVYCSKGNLGAALISFNEAMEMQLKALGPDHLEVAKTLHNIGVSHRHSKDLDQALEYYHKALRIFEMNLGREHLDTVRTLHNIGGVYRRQKKYDEAMSCFRDVLKVRRTQLGDNHPSVSITLVSIAAVLRRSGKVEEANTYYSEAMK